MDFSRVIKERYSVRKFKPDMICDDELNRILEAGMVAPTGCNYQPQRIYVLKSDEAIAIIRSLTRCAFDAPVVLRSRLMKMQIGRVRWKKVVVQMFRT